MTPDYESNTIEGAAILARRDTLPADTDRPSVADLQLDQREIDAFNRSRPRRFVVHDGYQWEAVS